jgi:hypothetical protein
MSERRLEDFCGIEWGKGALTPPPRPTPPSPLQSEEFDSRSIR